MDIFFAIAEPTRRTILELLAKKGRQTATDISDNFPTSAAAISQHLKVLRETHVVKVEKQGRERIYELNREKLYEFEKWAHTMTQVWNERLDRLGVIVETKKKKFIKK